MNSNAPGQLLGYTLQLQRALVYLLQAGPGDSVCVEVIGDVGVISDNSVKSEEDKSSVNKNPVTNKSSDLWKTFKNWTASVNAKELNLENTTFILYSNHAGKKGIVDTLSNAKTEADAQSAIEASKSLLSEVNHDHEIYSYLKEVLENEDLFLKIILKFEFVLGSKSSDLEVYTELIKKHIPEGQIGFMREELLGWVTTYIQDKIKNKEYSIITWEEFNQRFSITFERARRKDLLDFTQNNIPSTNEVSSQLKEYPYYIKQLQIIDLEEADQVQAVSDYLRSKVNMAAWIENDIIDESEAEAFDDNLTRFWKNTSKRISITNKSNSPEERGVLIYSDCMSRSERIANQDPPPSTVSGYYHTLADDDRIGWHESWKNILKNNKGKKS